MKKLIYIIVAGFFLAACTSPNSDKAKVTDPKAEARNASGDRYIMDAAASKIEWIGTKVTGYHEGTVKIKSGEVTVTNGMVTAGNFIIDMPTIVATGPAKVSEENSKKLTGHLRTADFFDVEKYPEATFVITDVKPFSGTVEDRDRDDPRQQKLNEYKVTDPTHRVSGNLTIRGVTKNIEFPARITVNNNVAEAKAKFNVNRKDWNIIYPGQPDDLIRDEIHLGIFLRATRDESLSNK
jgi:polyisoprenoid-binding protein YceI